MAKVQKSPLTSDVRRAEHSPMKSVPNVIYVSLVFRKSGSRDKSVNTGSVQLKLTYNRRVLIKSTGISCKSDEIDREHFAVKNNPTATLIIQSLRAKIQATFAEMRLTGRKIDLAVIWQVANGGIINCQIPNVSECLSAFLGEIRTEEKAGEVTSRVTEKIITFNKWADEYTTKQYGRNAHLDDITPADAKRFLLHLMSEHGLSRNYSASIVQHFKRVLNYAVENEWILRNPFMNYRRKLEKIKGEILTETEVDAIRSFELFAPALDHIRQAFLFQCFSGLSYAELVRVNVSNILDDAKTGMRYITIDRKKTGVNSIIPLNYEASRIIDWFKEHPARLQKGVLIPIISNQKYNAYLKQLAGVMGFQKRLTTHCARRTAATYFLTKGVSMESISAMLGHTNTVTTQKSYAITRPERVINDFLGGGIQIRKAE